MEFETLLGLAAGALTSIAFLPQFLKIWKTRSTKDISLKTFLILATGVFLWLIYGIMRGDLPVIASNLVILPLAAAILVMKIRYG